MSKDKIFYRKIEYLQHIIPIMNDIAELGEQDYYDHHALAVIKRDIDSVIVKLKKLKEYCILAKDY